MLIDLIFKYPSNEEENKRIFEEMTQINKELKKNKKPPINNNIEEENINVIESPEASKKNSIKKRIEALKAINSKVNRLKRSMNPLVSDFSMSQASPEKIIKNPL